MKLAIFSTAKKKKKNETKPMRVSESISKINASIKLTLDIFQNFAYVSSHLRLKSFALKGDCTISAKVKKPRN